MSRPKFIAGNWKMYTDRRGAIELATAVAKGARTSETMRVAVFPPAVWLTEVIKCVSGSSVTVGGQNCHQEREGAFTGEISAAMLVDAGCRHVIIGHSERRHGLGETDDVLNKKAKAALDAGLTVVFCVGELLAEREAGKTEWVLETQLTRGLQGISTERLKNLVLAYEPVWAIGTGKVATPDQAQAAHAYIRGKIATLVGEKTASELLIQYGGSVKPDNAAGLLKLPDVDGALVGGASLKADSFLAIVDAAA